MAEYDPNDHNADEVIKHLEKVDDQAEIDRLWSALSAVPGSEQCGWVKDRYGVSWQIVPRKMIEWMTTGDPGRRKRVFDAMSQMKKLNIAALEAAAEG